MYTEHENTCSGERSGRYGFCVARGGHHSGARRYAGGCTERRAWQQRGRLTLTLSLLLLRLRRTEIDPGASVAPTTTSA